MLGNAFIIMIIGMAVVFSFLIIMIIVMNVMSGVLQSDSFKKMFPEPVAAPAIPAPTRSNDLEEIAAVIAIAKANV